MGWCSGTNVFDPMVDTILEMKLKKSQAVQLITDLINVLEGEDWDCLLDSSYYAGADTDPIVKQAILTVHPTWDDCFTEGED